MLSDGPRILGAATEFLGAVRPGSRHAFMLSCHTVFGLRDLAGDLAHPRRKVAPMSPRGGHPRPEMLKVALFIASGHWGQGAHRVTSPTSSTATWDCPLRHVLRVSLRRSTARRGTRPPRTLPATYSCI